MWPLKASCPPPNAVATVPLYLEVDFTSFTDQRGGIHTDIWLHCYIPAGSFNISFNLSIHFAELFQWFNFTFYLLIEAGGPILTGTQLVTLVNLGVAQVTTVTRVTAAREAFTPSTQVPFIHGDDAHSFMFISHWVPAVKMYTIHSSSIVSSIQYQNIRMCTGSY